MRASRTAMTLIEVLAALVILSGAATSMLVAQGRALEQVKTASLEVEASALAQELIAQWRLDGAQTTDASAGPFDHKSGWSWRRSSAQVEIAMRVMAHQVTLELSYVPEDGRWSWRRKFAWLEKGDEVR